MAKLTLLFGNDPQGEYGLGSQTEYRIGRSHECDIVVDNLGVSRHHASIVADSGQWKVVDQGSNNGTFINEQQVSQHVLQHQDRIVLGKFSLVFDAYGDAAGSSTASTDAAPKQSSAGMGSEMTMFVDPDQIKKMQADLKSGNAAKRMTLQMRMGNRDANCPLVKSETIIGSSKSGEADLPIRGLLIKPVQAKVIKTDQGHRLTALGGWRAVRVNGQKVAGTVDLRSGDVIVIAGNTITYKTA